MKSTLFISLLLFAALYGYSQNNQSNGNNDDNYPAPVDNNSNSQQQNNNSTPPPPGNSNTPPQNNYNNTPDNSNPPSNNYNNQAQSNYNNQPPVDYNSPSYQTFYDGLSPYGTWVNYQGYGYAWVPNVAPGFTPYSTNGYWVYSSYGWMWNSGYDWGWAPFHYGRWLRDSMYGWMWVPGNQWAPAWVTWGSYGGYYGWAPLAPGIGLNEAYIPPMRYWSFVPAENFNQPHVAHYRVSNKMVVHDNINIISNSSTYNQNTYFSGPKREEVEQATGSKISPVRVNEAHQPAAGGGVAVNNEVNIYRPNINSSTAAKAAPAKVAAVEDLKPINNHPQQQQTNKPNGQQQGHVNNKQNRLNKPAQPQRPNTQQQHTAPTERGK